MRGLEKGLVGSVDLEQWGGGGCSGVRPACGETASIAWDLAHVRQQSGHHRRRHRSKTRLDD